MKIKVLEAKNWGNKVKPGKFVSHLQITYNFDKLGIEEKKQTCDM